MSTSNQEWKQGHAPPAAFNLQDAFKPAIQVHQYGMGPRVYCACCGREVIPRDNVFKCSRCGREPIHESCGDAEFGWCAGCVQEYRAEEQEREHCPRLALRLKGFEGERTVFLFAKRTLQFGRSREDQLPPMRHTGKAAAYSPGANDVVARVMQRQGSELVVSTQASKLVGRVHGAFRVARDHGRAILQVIDSGLDGSGCTNGIWANSRRLPAGAWCTLADFADVTLGRDPAAHLEGLTLGVRVVRDTSNRSEIDAVVFSRKDALEMAHSYVMVVREAAVGLGALPLSLFLEQEAAEWGRIAVQETKFWYRPCPDSPLQAANSALGCAVPCIPGTALAAGEFEITVLDVSDRDFYS